MENEIKKLFPVFAENIDKLRIQNELPPLGDVEIKFLEKVLGVSLPPSYKSFLSCTKGFIALGGSIQMQEQHPFFHEFKPLCSLTEEQKNFVKRRGGM
jgi:hypothetical protein